MFKRTNPSQRHYPAAFAVAEHTVSQSQQIRENHMAVFGAESVVLAEIGCLALGKRSTQNMKVDEDLRNLCADYVGIGSELAFRLMHRVIKPASLLLGPDGFKVEPTDIRGNSLKLMQGEATDTFKSYVTRQRMFWLGESRGDYHLAAALHIARDVVSRGLSERKTLKLAESMARSGECDGYAKTSLLNAADITLELAYASQGAREGVGGFDFIGAVSSPRTKKEPIVIMDGRANT